MTVDVTILLSAYDGALYLPAQVDSIRRQRDVTWSLQVRDDGSPCAATRALLADYADDPRIRVDFGHNIGAAASFFELLRTADADARYFAFADQDDYWLEHKLARAKRALDSIDPRIPGAYGARLKIGDADLGPVGMTPKWPRPPGFGNAIVENILSGCTLVINRAAREAMLQTPVARITDIQMHDAWCYMICTALGRVIFDPEPCLIYRQHARNCIGSGATPWQRLVAKLNHQARGGSGIRLRRQAHLFLDTFADALAPRDQAVLARFVERDGPAANLRTAADWRLWRQFPLDDMAMRLLIASGRI